MESVAVERKGSFMRVFSVRWTAWKSSDGILAHSPLSPKYLSWMKVMKSSFESAVGC
jgi:hypothetical protein